MGVEWGEDEIVIKPFLETATFRNLSATRAAVVNLTDDVLLFARAAISSPQFPAGPASVVRGAVLEAACSWRELEVRAIDATPPRPRASPRPPSPGAATWAAASGAWAQLCRRRRSSSKPAPPPPPPPRFRPKAPTPTAPSSSRAASPGITASPGQGRT